MSSEVFKDYIIAWTRLKIQLKYSTRIDTAKWDIRAD